MFDIFIQPDILTLEMQKLKGLISIRCELLFYARTLGNIFTYDNNNNMLYIIVFRILIFFIIIK